jgi:hypothetical protein
MILTLAERETETTSLQDSAPPPRSGQGRLVSGKFAARIRLSDLRAVFANGPLPKSEAVAALCQATGCAKSAAYDAISRRMAAFLSLTPNDELVWTERVQPSSPKIVRASITAWFSLRGNPSLPKIPWPSARSQLCSGHDSSRGTSAGND